MNNETDLEDVQKALMNDRKVLNSFLPITDLGQGESDAIPYTFYIICYRGMKKKEYFKAIHFMYSKLFQFD